MDEKSECLRTCSINGIDPKYLKQIKIVDLYDTGETKSFIIDNFKNTTPIFDKLESIIPLSEKDCMFLGQCMGDTKLYIVNGSEEEKEKFYDVVDLEGNPKELINIDPKYALINSVDGMYFFDKEDLKRTSDVFDKISLEYVEGKKFFSFEKTIKNEETSKKLTGTVTPDGRIGFMIYDDSINGLKATPKIKNNDSYEELDYVSLYKELDFLKEYKKVLRNSNIKKLSILNRDR